MTLPRRRRGGGKVADREERCLSEHRSSLRLSLLSHLPNHCRDLSWISLRLDPEQVCLRGPCVCVSPKCFSLSALLLTASISASLPLWHQQRGKKEWDSHHTDSHSAKSKQPCQKNVKSLPFTHHGYWRGRINWGWDSPYSSSSYSEQQFNMKQWHLKLPPEMWLISCSRAFPFRCHHSHWICGSTVRTVLTGISGFFWARNIKVGGELLNMLITLIPLLCTTQYSSTLF